MAGEKKDYAAAYARFVLNHRWAIILLLCADTFARVLVAPAEMPIGIVTAAIGAPFFLVLLLRQRTLVGL